MSRGEALSCAPQGSHPPPSSPFSGYIAAALQQMNSPCWTKPSLAERNEVIRLGRRCGLRGGYKLLGSIIAVLKGLLFGKKSNAEKIWNFAPLFWPQWGGPADSQFIVLFFNCNRRLKFLAHLLLFGEYCKRLDVKCLKIH